MITVVSGLPRSGTSMMMQMLGAGGLSVLCDDERKADSDNPKGYWEPVKQLRARPELIAQGEGKVVKMFSPFICFLPADHEFRIIFLHRPLLEVLKSQEQMLRRGVNKHAPLDHRDVDAAFRWHLTSVADWQFAQPNIRFLRVDYHRVLFEPTVAATEIATFLGLPLKVDAMVQQVDRSLYRTRLEHAS
jgi:hypothetical protein